MPTKSYLLLPITLLFCALACGCNGGSQDSQSASAPGPAQRWPGQGSYQYNLVDNGCATGNQNFTAQSDYCLALEDYARNNGCAREDRRDLYQHDCGDDFHETNAPAPIAQPNPPVPAPVTPAPTPTPPPAPTPPPPVPEGPKVVQELAAQGITVKVNRDGVMPIPGEPSFDDRLLHFWDVLEAAEPEIVAKKAQITTIDLAEYAAYATAYQSLTLSVDMNIDDLHAYLGVLDRLQAWQTISGITLDLGIEGYGRYGGGTTDLTQKMAFFENNGAQVAHAVKTIELDNDTIYSLFDRRLTIDFDHYQENFNQFARILGPSQPFFQLVDALGIDVSNGNFELDVDSSADNAAFLAVTQALAKEKAALTALSHAGVLKELDLSSSNSENHFYPELKKFEAAVQGDGLVFLPLLFSLIPDQVKFARANGIAFDYGYNDLGADFVQASQHLAQVFPAIHAKASLVKTIEFSDSSGFNYSVLTVGTKDSLAALQKVVAGIQ